MRTTAFLIFSLIFINNSFAQEVTTLDPANVTSSRFIQKNSSTGRHVTVISAEEISKLPVNSIDDLLKYASGVEVQQRGPAGTQADISIRGGTFQQVLVLIDGMKLNDPITGHFSAYFPVDISQIDRIEILKGTAAAVYGAEAVGGVINIITKVFNDAKGESSKKILSVSGGDFGYYRAGAALENYGKVKYSVAGSSTNANGPILRTQRNAFFNNNAVSLNTAFSSGNATFYFHSAYDDRDFAAENYYTTFKSDTASERVKTWWNHFKIKVNHSKATEEFDLVYKQASDHYEFNPVTKANDNRSKMFSLQYLKNIKDNDRLQLVYGTSFENKRIISNDRGNHYNNHVAAFITSFYTWDKLKINAGLRSDYDQLYKLKLLPTLSLAYAVNNFNFRALAGRSIRSADFTERFNNYNKTGLRSGTIGNPDLQPELGWNYEAGIDLIKSNLRISASAFLRDQENVIDFVTTPYSSIPRKHNLAAGGVYAYAMNIRKVKTSGVETEVVYKKNISPKTSFQNNLAAMVLHSETGDSINSFYIVSHAHAIIQNTFLLRSGNFELSMNAIYKKRKGQQANAIFAEISRDYILWNGKAAYNLKKLQAFVTVHNISNISYSDLLGSVMPGRWAIGGLQLTF